MKRIIFFIPFIIALIFYIVMAIVGLKINAFPAIVAVICFFVSGLLLSYGKVWGGIFSIIISGMIIYNGFSNWKLGDLEIRLGVILIIFYLACSSVVHFINKKTIPR